MGGVEIKSEWFELGESDADPSVNNQVEISGRVRLLGVTHTGGENGNNTVDVNMRTSSHSGASLFEYQWYEARWANPINAIFPPKGGIVFDDGLYVTVANTTTKSYIRAMTFLYQLG